MPNLNRPELDPNAEFPNLADVPARPTTMSPAEREKLRQELLRNNQAQNQDMDLH